VRNADKVLIEPGLGEFDPNQTRSVQVQPQTTTTYRLIARNRYGEQLREVVVIVQNAPEPPAPVITRFYAEPPQIKRGESVLLRWETQNATELIPYSARTEVRPRDARLRASPLAHHRVRTHRPKRRRQVSEQESQGGSD
jgi:hypothetical protein